MQLHTKKKSRSNRMLFNITIGVVIAHIFLLCFTYIKMRKYLSEFKEKEEKNSEDLQKLYGAITTLKLYFLGIKDEQAKIQIMLESIGAHQQIADEKLERLVGEKQLVTKLRKKKDGI